MALGGGAYAAVKLRANSVGSKQVKPDSLDGRDVNEAKLGQVPSAADSGSVDGVDSAALARTGPLDWIAVQEAHQSGNPPGRFACLGSDGVVCDELFQNFDGPGGHANAAFSRDQFGIVRLQGSISGFTNSDTQVTLGPIFVLPPGFRPAERHVFAVLEDAPRLYRLDVTSDGAVDLDTPWEDGDFIFLNGISFPCGPSGQDGCP